MARIAAITARKNRTAPPNAANIDGLNAFVLPNGECFSPTGLASPTIVFPGNPTVCGAAGTLQQWKSQVAAPLARQHVPAFLVMAAFAGPILKLVSRSNNFGFELVGEGGIGKSTAQMLMASVAGSPSKEPSGNVLSMDATRVGLASKMATYADLSLIMDEAMSFAPDDTTRGRGKKIRELAMKLGQGHETLKHGRTEPRLIRLVFTISTNEAMSDMVRGDSRSSTEAAEDRLISMKFDQSRPFGVWRKIPKGYDAIGDFAKALEAASIVQHGTAIRAFLQRLVDHRHTDEAGLRGGLERRVTSFKDSVGITGNDGSAGRVAEAFGIVMAAGQLAQRYGALPPEFDCEKIVRSCYRLSVGRRPRHSGFLDELRKIARSGEAEMLNAKSPKERPLEALQRGGVFLHVNKYKETELLFWPDYFRKRFPNWAQAIRKPEVAEKMDKDINRATKKRPIRAGYKPEAVYCFVLDR